MSFRINIIKRSSLTERILTGSSSASSFSLVDPPSYSDSFLPTRSRALHPQDSLSSYRRLLARILSRCFFFLRDPGGYMYGADE